MKIATAIPQNWMPLGTRWVNHVVGLSESGMGYHMVNVHLADGRILKEVAIFSGEYLAVDTYPFEFAESDITDIVLSD